MTRGQLILLLGNNQFMNSIEFNGDMYPSYVDDDGNHWDGHGNEAFDMLSKVTNVDEYQQVVTAFDDKNFGYTKLDHEPQMIFKGHGKKYFDLTKNYFDNWFSDYLYIKNISNEDITFIAYDKGDSQKKVTAIIPAGGIGVFNFDHVADDIDSDIIITKYIKPLPKFRITANTEIDGNFDAIDRSASCTLINLLLVNMNQRHLKYCYEHDNDLTNGIWQWRLTTTNHYVKQTCTLSLGLISNALTSDIPDYMRNRVYAMLDDFVNKNYVFQADFQVKLTENTDGETVLVVNDSLLNAIKQLVADVQSFNQRVKQWATINDSLFKQWYSQAEQLVAMYHTLFKLDETYCYLLQAQKSLVQFNAQIDTENVAEQFDQLMNKYQKLLSTFYYREVVKVPSIKVYYVSDEQQQWLAHEDIMYHDYDLFIRHLDTPNDNDQLALTKVKPFS